MDPADVRADLDLDDVAYLNWGASGPAPGRVLDAADAAQRRHERHAHTDGDPYVHAADAFADTREAVADLLDTDAGHVALTDSTADGISRVANAVAWEPGDTVVRTDLEHPAGVLPWDRLADEGVTVRELACPGGRLDRDALRDAVADARLLCLNAVSWLHGTHLDVATAVDIAHDAGALVLIDAVQSPGQVPVPVAEWGADFVAAAGHKWLAGVWGAGFLWVREPARWRPRHLGYNAVADSTAPPAASPDYHEDARRFEVGTNSLAPYAALREAIALHHEVGPAAIRDRIDALTERLLDGLGDRLVSPRPAESGLVTFRVDDRPAFLERADEAGVVVRGVPREGWVRASVHAFNAERDVERLLALV